MHALMKNVKKYILNRVLRPKCFKLWHEKNIDIR